MDPTIHYRIHNSPPLFPVLSQMNPVHALTTYVFKIHFNIISHIGLCSLRGLAPSGFPTKAVCAFLVSDIRATHPVQVTLLDFLTRIVFGGEYQS